MSIPAKYQGTCPGSGKSVKQKDAWNIHNPKRGVYEGEGWRTTCPDCGKESAVGPTSHMIQKHTFKPPKLTKEERLNLLYEDTYEKVKTGESLRPSPNWPKKDIDTWLMAYLDGCGDNEADGRKVGALKRWMNANGLSSYAKTIDTP